MTLLRRPPTAAVVGALVRLRLRRVMSRLATGLSAGKKKAARSGTARKQGGAAMPVIFGGVFLFQGFQFSLTACRSVVEHLGAPALPGVAALLLAFLCGVLVLLDLGLANRELARLDWDLEWLLTLPLSIPTIYLAKLAEQTALNFFGWFSVLPLLMVLGREAGLGWWALVLALPLTVLVLVCLAVLRLLLEVVARRYAPAAVARNLQAVATVGGIVGLVVVMSPGLPVANSTAYPWELLRQLSTAAAWLPLGQPALLVGAPRAGAGLAVPVAVLALQAALVLGGGWWALVRLHEHGAPEGRGTLQGQRGAVPVRGTWRGGGIVAKELRLLARDRRLFANVVIGPTVVVGLQFLLYPALLRSAMDDAAHLAALAFGLGAYLLLATTSIVANEQAGLWLLYTVPMRLETLFLRKALMWIPLALLYTGAVLLFGLRLQGASLGLLSSGLFALVGLPLYAMVGGAISMFASDPNNPEPQKRIRPDYVFGFMLLEGLYVYGFYAPSFWQRLALLVLLSALALALWQSAAARIPYLLDPTALPPPTVTLSDGLVAALVFLVGQGLFVLFFAGAVGWAPWPATTAAFGCSGALTVLLALGELWRRKVPALFRELGFRWPGGGALVRWSAAGCCTIVAVAVGYIWLSRRWPWLAAAFAAFGEGAPQVALGEVPWIAALTLLGAPICEEILFRGIIFNGLRRLLPLRWAVIASALIFAVLHPPLAVVPVFCVGIVTAVVFHRSGSLLPAIAVHVAYNLVWITLLAFAAG